MHQSTPTLGNDFQMGLPIGSIPASIDLFYMNTALLQPAKIEPITAEMAQDLVRYREGVETLLNLRSDKPISNSEPAHAAILFEVFFRHAKEHVRIFCNKLSSKVFDNAELVHEAREALKRSVKISVMVQQDEPEDSAFLKTLHEAGIVVLRASGAVKDSLYNFAVMDTISVRIEPDRNEWKAQARMFVPELASSLAKVFDTLALSQAVPFAATEVSPAYVTG